MVLISVKVLFLIWFEVILGVLLVIYNSDPGDVLVFKEVSNLFLLLLDLLIGLHGLSQVKLILRINFLFKILN